MKKNIHSIEITWIMSVIILLSISLIPKIVFADTPVSLKSYNYPDRFIRHQNYEGVLTTVQSRLDIKDSSFHVRAGLANGRGTISFESVNYPGYYLRHQNYQLKLHKYQRTDLFHKDATFVKRRGLKDHHFSSFESVNFPGYFIRHQNFRLLISRGNSDLFLQDATFKIVYKRQPAAKRGHNNKPAAMPSLTPPSGSYQQTCRNIIVKRHNREKDRLRLDATCRTRSGHWVNARLKNYYRTCHGDIYNDNGVLRCH